MSPIRRSCYSDEQAVSTLREAEAGIPVAVLLRKLGVSCNAYYRWHMLDANLRARTRRALVPSMVASASGLASPRFCHSQALMGSDARPWNSTSVGGGLVVRKWNCFANAGTLTSNAREEHGEPPPRGH